MFVREPSTGIVINTDDSHYKAIEAERFRRKENEKLVAELNGLRDELTEIKTLLQQINIGKKNG